MTLSADESNTLKEVIISSLDEAEDRWTRHGRLLKEATAADRAMSRADEQVPSKIPGAPIVTSAGSKVENFVALVADMRGSSEHLQSVLNGPRVEKLQRVYYETAALLPALEVTIRFEEGSVTEYLGDGVLALFGAESATDMDAVHKARRAAENCVGRTLDLVNDELEKRYGLPALKIGVGLAIGPAIVQLVGLPASSHAKAIGACVWRASKLCAGVNVVAVDATIHNMWPTSKGAPLIFIRRDMRGVEGYVLRRNEPAA